eukprot:scaffold6934_cov121-Isochrysis_galbana.AAC.14
MPTPAAVARPSGADSLTRRALCRTCSAEVSPMQAATAVGPTRSYQTRAAEGEANDTTAAERASASCSGAHSAGTVVYVSRRVTSNPLSESASATVSAASAEHGSAAKDFPVAVDGVKLLVMPNEPSAFAVATPTDATRRVGRPALSQAPARTLAASGEVTTTHVKLPPASRGGSSFDPGSC